MEFLPEVLQFTDGRKVESEADWEERRQEILKILSENQFGITPGAPKKVTRKLVQEPEIYCAGHGVLETWEIHVETEKGTFSFPCRYYHPTDKKKAPLFLYIAFEPKLYFQREPFEEMIDRGFAVLKVIYTDVTSDDGDFSTGIAPYFERRNDGTDFGKIGMWAYALSRTLDAFSDSDEN